MLIDWQSKQTQVLCNPRFSLDRQKQIEKALLSLSLSHHLFLSSSGSVKMKWVALSKEAILCSAKSVNHFFDASEKDIWVHPLPLFHIGGVAIYARAFLSGAQVFTFKEKWEPNSFCQALHTHCATLSALVPTQLYDLVNAHLTPPLSLRAVIIGGGALSESLYKRAQALGWPMHPSFGMTECASQIATAKARSSDLILLPHIQVEVRDKKLAFKSDALLSGYAIEEEGTFHYTDPKRQGWFLTEDLGEIEGNLLKLFGRKEHFLKIGGESVNLLRLQQILEMLAQGFEQTVMLFPEPDSRLGHVICLAIESSCSQRVESLVEQFNAKVLPFERIRKSCIVSSLPRTSLGKLVLKSP